MLLDHHNAANCIKCTFVLYAWLARLVKGASIKYVKRVKEVGERLRKRAGVGFGAKAYARFGECTCGRS